MLCFGWDHKNELLSEEIIINQKHKIYPILYPEDRGNMFLQDAGTYYTMSYPRS
jgi:hypothetical protein